jgi:hypothetical protein
VRAAWICIAFASRRVLQSVSYGVQVVVALLAPLPPAFMASRVDPMVALRCE